VRGRNKRGRVSCPLLKQFVKHIFYCLIVVTLLTPLLWNWDSQLKKVATLMLDFTARITQT